MIRVNLLAPELTPVGYRTQKSKPFILFGLQVLCKVKPGDETSFVKLSKHVGLSTFLVSASSTLSVPKNPLRVITARSSQFEDFYNDGTQHLAFFIDTLACGHQQILFNLVDDGKKRHRCPECAAARVEALPPKKPARSVKVPGVLKRAA